jgi:polar amino acid transport system substrate-binding protein
MQTIIMIMICVIFNSIAFAGQKEELPLATGEWPPYTSKELNGYGFISQIITETVQEMGMVPKYTFYPWKRVEKMTQAGMYFGAFPYAVTKERLESFDFSDLIFENKTILFYNKTNLKQKPEWKTLTDLKPFLIGGVNGYSYIPDFKTAGLKAEYVTVDEQNIKKLYHKRIDLAVIDLLVGWEIIQKLYPQEISKFGTVEKAIKSGNSHVMISNKYPNNQFLKKQFNFALETIKHKGIYYRIHQKYGIPSTKE